MAFSTASLRKGKKQMIPLLQVVRRWVKADVPERIETKLDAIEAELDSHMEKRNRMRRLSEGFRAEQSEEERRMHGR